MAEEYIPFEDALRRLELQDAQLKRLISENEIKAYRDGERMKLKRDDVERLRSRIVEDASAPQTEELVFEDDESGEEPGMATVPIAEAETLVEAPAPRKPASRAAASRATAAPAKKAAPAPRRAKAKDMPAEDAGNEGTLVKAAMLLAFLVLIVSIPFAFDNVKGYAGSISHAVVKPKN